jgi:hypothetical protein
MSEWIHPCEDTRTDSGWFTRSEGPSNGTRADELPTSRDGQPSEAFSVLREKAPDDRGGRTR